MKRALVYLVAVPVTLALGVLVGVAVALVLLARLATRRRPVLWWQAGDPPS